jgi:hypothetical protein
MLDIVDQAQIHNVDGNLRIVALPQRFQDLFTIEGHFFSPSSFAHIESEA